MKFGIRMLRQVLTGVFMGSVSLFVIPEIYGQRGNRSEYLGAAEAARVKKFADAFLHSLEKTRDIDRVPRDMFARPFEEVMVAGRWKHEISDPAVPLTRRERLDRSVQMFNFLYLGVLYAARGYMVPGDLEVSDIYPPAVIEIMSKSSLLSPMLDLDFDKTSLSIVKPPKFYTAIESINAEFRKYLVRHPREWRNKYWQTVAAGNDGDNERPYRYLCNAEDCHGLPQNSELIHTGAFPFDLILVNRREGLGIARLGFISE
jgi:hypothetical protein